MFRFLMNLFRVHQGSAETLDHVPVHNTEPKVSMAELRAIARERHDKPFHADLKHKRETPPSRALQEIRERVDMKAAKAAAKKKAVPDLGERREAVKKK